MNAINIIELSWKDISKIVEETYNKENGTDYKIEVTYDSVQSLRYPQFTVELKKLQNNNVATIEREN